MSFGRRSTSRRVISLVNHKIREKFNPNVGNWTKNNGHRLQGSFYIL